MKNLLLILTIPFCLLFSQEINSVEPDVAVQGDEVWVMIYAEETNFLVADTVGAPSNVDGVSIESMIDGSIINSISFTPITNTSLEAIFVIPDDASPGEYNVIVEQGGNYGVVVGTDAFYIEQEPMIISIDPNSAEVGSEIWVTITGAETQFVVTDTVGAPSNVASVILKLNDNVISALSFTSVSAAELQAMFVIPEDVELGTYDVVVEQILALSQYVFGLNAFTIYGSSANLDQNDGHPVKYSLNQNYPNPFNPNTSISFSIPRSDNGSLNIYDLNGTLVRELKKGFMQAGDYKETWNGKNNDGKIVPSGYYIYQLKSKSYTSARKMLMIK